MSKVIVVSSSPRRNSNSESLGAVIAEEVKNAGGEAIIFNIREKKLSPCLGCDWCKKQSAPACVQKDDFGALVPELADADAFVLLSPIYFGQINGPAKNFIDRFYCFFNPATPYDLKKDRKVGVVLSYGGSPAELTGAVANYVAGCFNTLGANQSKILLAGGTHAAGEALTKEDYVQAAKDMGKWLAE